MSGTGTAANANANANSKQQPATATRTNSSGKPPPLLGPTPPAPSMAAPAPAPTSANATKTQTQGQAQVNGTHANQTQNHAQHNHNHNHAHAQTQPKGKKKADLPVDPQAMYESLKSKIAALEEELTHADEEEERFAEEAQKSVRGMEENAIHNKYIELFAEMKRIERDHAKEKQKLVKDKDSAKSQLTKANQTKAKLESLARDLTRDNKKLREEKTQLLQDVSKNLDQIKQLSEEILKGKEKAKQQEVKYREYPDIVVKVICKYRAELFFKISRKTKLSRLFTAWSERMETVNATAMRKAGISVGSGTAGTGAAAGTGSVPAGAGAGAQVNGSTPTKGGDTPNTSVNGVPPPPSAPAMTFVYTHQGRSLDPDMTIEEAGIDDADEILAVEMMDLTGPMPDDAEEVVETHRPKLRKNWTDNPREAKKAMEEIFDSVTRERLKLVLRQYELRERHFECFVRSKELELLLSRYREQEQRQLVETEKSRASQIEEDVRKQCNQLRKELEDAHNGQTLLIEKLIQCCKEPNAERTQRLFTSLREELEKRGTKVADVPVGG